MSKNFRNGNREMETRRKTRKAFPYNRKILELYQKSLCRECSVQVSAVEINAVLEKTRPLSDKEVAKILEGHASDTDTSILPNNPLSPRTESRLRRKENGMVLLPRSFYNEHPAKKVLDSKKSKSKSTTKDKKDTHKHGSSSQSKDDSKSIRARNNSSTKQKENEPLGRGLRQKTPKQNKLKVGKPSFSNANFPKNKVARRRKVNGLKPARNNETEYQLVFVDPITSNGRKVIDPTLLSLADLLNTDKLPSKIWEVERVPPLLVNTKSDVTYNAIAAELNALMADTEQPDPVESMDTNPDLTDEKQPRDLDEEVPPKSNEVNESPTTHILTSNGGNERDSIEDVAISAEVNADIAMEVDSIEVDSSIEKAVSENPKDSTKDEESSMENVKIEAKEKSLLENEKVEDKVESFTENEKVEKMDTNVKEGAKEVETEVADIKESTNSKNDETIDIKDVIEEKKDELMDADIENIKVEKKVNENEMVKDDEEKSILEEGQITKEQEESVADPESNNSIEATNPEEEPAKVPEEFPSIMDLLNDTPSSILDDSKEVKEEPSDKTESSQEKLDQSSIKLNLETLGSNSEEISLKDILDESITQPIDKPADKNITDSMEDKNSTDEAKISGNEDDEITSVVFRRFSSDKQTYDRLVIFQSDLEYTVKINNKEVELLGAPKYMTSTEDLQILLQIVDEVNLDSFNVICKS